MAAMDAPSLLFDLVRPRLGGRPLVLGLAGAQGSGKSTLAAGLSAQLTAAGWPTQAVSLDDLYLPHARRRALAAAVHPLLATRGVPGTHDLPLLLDRLAQVRAGKPTRLPRFDKLADDRLPPQRWRSTPPLACLVLEGWCIGAKPQPAALLLPPINDLEAREDADGRWRRWVNDALAGAYQRLWAHLDLLAFLSAPDWKVVPQWRMEQETRLAHATGRRGMDQSAMARFCAHYERLTRWQLATTPAHADLTLHLDAGRQVTGFHKR